MANDATAPAQPPGPPSEDEYQSFCAALSASARGRAFLAEYARRHRGADTETLLAALARLEALVRARPGADTAQPELRKLLASIRAARPELEQSTLPARAAKLAVLLDLLERRLETLSETSPAPAAEAGRLTAVPPLEEPELPIPSPAATRPALSVAHERSPPPLSADAKPAGSAAIIPEVTWFDAPPPGAVALELEHDRGASPTMAEKVAALNAQPAAPLPEPDRPAMPPQKAPPAESAKPPVADPLAVLMALSEEERIALFT